MSTTIDVVTQIQEEVNRFASHTYNTVGILQRDSAPISIDTGSVVPSGQEAQADAATQARVSEMVSEITKSSKTIEELVEALPEHDQNEARQTEELNSLQKESDRLAQELEKELQRVRIVLGEVSHCYADIVDAQLARQLKTPGGSSTAVNVGLEGTVPWQQNT
mmetsp:Transcript_6876/g.25365  ORF Transcript_6876/g.25365 Transcript_6876/m.25365 type:complete len:164 (-) Transcript_6876:127-618(-)